MNLFYRTYGTGEPVLIAHGMYSMSDNWIPVAKILADSGYRVIIPDLPNHGQSPHLATHIYAEIADALHELLAQLEITKVSIIGHSMGGKVMMEFMNLYPESVLKAVFVDIAPRKYTKLGTGLNHREILEFMSAFDWTNVKSRAEFTQNLPEEYTKDAQFFLKNVRRSKTGGLEWKINAPVILEYLDEIGREIEFKAPQTPCLFVKGGLSGYISEQDISFLRNIPNTNIVTILEGGHRLHSQNTPELSKIILDFLKLRHASIF